MGLGFFLIPTLGGYWFLTHLHATRYATPRASGYHVFFQAAIAGGVLFIFSYTLLLLLEHTVPQITAMWNRAVPIPYSGTAVLSALLGFLLPAVGNQFYGEEKAARRTARKSRDPIELLMVESIEQQKLIEISLRTGKSYVGFGLEGGITQGEPYVALIPMASGYRDTVTQELRLTTHYAPVIQESLEAVSTLVYEDFRIVIPISEIMSARIFHPDVYERFQGVDHLTL